MGFSYIFNSISIYSRVNMKLCLYGSHLILFVGYFIGYKIKKKTKKNDLSTVLNILDNHYVMASNTHVYPFPS